MSKGAFTGALADKVGRFEVADGGTLFLDEIGELDPELQAKLLRVLQDGEFERIGSAQTQRVDVRVIAATNRDLQRGDERREFPPGLVLPAVGLPDRGPAAAGPPRGYPLARLAFHHAANSGDWARRSRPSRAR